MSTGGLNQSIRVSVKLMAGEEASAIAEAACIDNPGAMLEDNGSYLTVSNDRSLNLNIQTIEEELGHPYDVPALLVVLVSYTGQVDVSDTGVCIREALTD